MSVRPTDSGLSRVQTCIRVALYQTKNGLPSAWARSTKDIAASWNSSSTVSMRLRVSGPVSSMRPSAKE
jgi:hypothetical protein